MRTTAECDEPLEPKLLLTKLVLATGFCRLAGTSACSPRSSASELTGSSSVTATTSERDRTLRETSKPNRPSEKTINTLVPEKTEAIQPSSWGSVIICDGAASAGLGGRASFGTMTA